MSIKTDIHKEDRKIIDHNIIIDFLFSLCINVLDDKDMMRELDTCGNWQIVLSKYWS